MDDKLSKDKKRTPLQDKKAEELQELKEEKINPAEEPKPKTKRKKKKVEIDFTRLQSEADGLLALLQSLRETAGITKPLPETTRLMFAGSYVSLIEKYGEKGFQFMPEILMGCALLMIGIDTYKNLPKRSSADKESKGEKKISNSSVLDESARDL